jgi:photosystem II stability/assembly factor-like uncharacterized protein
LRLRILALALLILRTSGGICAQTWQRLGPEGGMVVSLEATKGDEVYLGTADGHVFASKDGAKSWELRGRVGSRLDAVVTCIVVDPGEDRIFAAVWYQEPGAGGGVFESDDHGRSWKLLGLQAEAVRALEIAPSQPNELVAGTRTGVFLSSDAGKSWRRISPEGDEEIKNLDSLAIDPRDPQVIYAGTYHLPWLTRDAGKSWKAVIAGIIDDSDIMSLRLDAKNPDRVYMSACSGIYRSENQGAEWIKLQGIPYAARRTQVIVQDPTNAKTLYAGTTEGLWVTRDGGESWTRTTAKEWVVNSLVILGGKSGTPGRVVLGTEGRGIEISDDAGVTFTEANHGFTHVIVKKLLADEHNSGHLLMIVERSAAEILESRDGGQNWSSLSMMAQDRGKQKTKTLNADEVQDVLSSPWGWLLRLENGQFWLRNEGKKSWEQWKLVMPGPVPRGARPTSKKTTRSQPMQKFAPDAVIVFSGNDAIVSTSEGLLRCRESGACTRVKAFGTSGQVHAVASSSSGQEIGIVMDGKLGWSSDNGETATWRDLPVVMERVSWLELADSGGEKMVYLGTSEGVFSSQAENSSWQKVAGGLPAGQVEQWLNLPRLWAATERDGGFYVSQDGHSWQRVDQDAERSRFTGLVATPDAGVLAGSQSEGLLRLDLTQKP